MATAPTYCTHRQLKDVFPQVDSFDSKRALYGWQIGIDGFDSGDTIDIYHAHNTGLVSSLFFDGAKVLKTTFTGGGSTIHGVLNGAMTDATVEFNLDAGHSVEIDDIIKIDSEYIRVTAVSTNAITTTLSNRGLFDTSAVAHADDANVYIIINESSDLGNVTSGGLDCLTFVYDDDLDLLLLVANSGDPNDFLLEAGEDFSTLITRITANASRYLDAKLDPNLPKEQLKDKEGNFDYIIVRTTALIAATFLIRSHDPTSEIANALMEDAMGNIDALNKGSAALSWQTTGDSSKGIIRDVSYTSGSIRPVDTRGRWSGSFDLIRVLIVAGGAMDGTATYSVWVKDGDKLGNQQGNQVVTAEKINGDYQTLAGGLQIRFGGESKTSVATATNEWEIEVAGWQEEVDNSAINSVRMTRR